MQDAVLDACALINLLAAGQSLLPLPTKGKDKKRSSRGAPSTPHRLGLTLHVPARVADEETLYLLQPDPDDARKLIKTPVQLAPYLKAGLLQRCDLEGQQETDLFVNLATRLDDGEAACLAIAAERGWVVATDDRVARKAAAELHVRVITTPELVKQWASASRANDNKARGVLQSIQRFARFTPPRTSPEYPWWTDLLGRTH